MFKVNNITLQSLADASSSNITRLPILMPMTCPIKRLCNCPTVNNVIFYSSVIGVWLINIYNVKRIILQSLADARSSEITRLLILMRGLSYKTFLSLSYS